MAGPPSQPAARGAPNPSVASHQAVYAELLALAGAGHTRQGFVRRALAVIGRLFASPFAYAYWRDGADVLTEEHHSGRTSPTFWRAAVRDFVTDAMARGNARARLLSERKSSLRIALLASPLYDSEGAVCGALGVVVQADESEAAHHLTTLEALTAFTSHLTLAARAPAAGPVAATAPGAPSAAVARSAQFTSPTELAFSLTNSLRVKFGLEQVALGIAAGSHIRLLSVSGLAEFKPRSPGVVCIRHAMEECLDIGEQLVAQRDAAHTELLSTGHALQRRWHESSHHAAVASVPLKVGERVAAVVALRHVGGQTFSRELLEKIRAAVEPYAPALEMLQRADRSVPRHILDSIRSGVNDLVTPGRWSRKASVVAVAAGVLWFLFGTLPYDVPAHCVIAPARLRHLTMPYSGVLASAVVVPGDAVSAGQVVAELDRRALELSRAELEAEEASLEQDRLRAAAGPTPADAQAILAKLRVTRAKLESVRHQIEQSIIRAPFDGIVVTGDLRPQVGALLAQGAPLLQIAPRNGWQLQLEIPESSAAQVRAGAALRFALESRPEQTFEARVTRQAATAEVRKQQNVFVAEADFDPTATWLRPGMEGISRISAARRPVWWLCFHHALDYLQLHWWL